MNSCIKLGKRVSESNPRKTFRFELEYMHGDADGDSTDVFDIENEDHAIAFDKFLKANENKGRHCDEWEDSDFFDESMELDFYWMYDAGGTDHQASYEGYTLTYFDENGIEFEAEIK